MKWMNKKLSEFMVFYLYNSVSHHLSLKKIALHKPDSRTRLCKSNFSTRLQSLLLELGYLSLILELGYRSLILELGYINPIRVPS